MIQRLEIENLKSLGGRHSVEMAPITLIYGPNSSGKSSLLQALAVLKQTLEPRAARLDIERQPLNLRGELVDLGSFGAAVHRHELKRPLRLGVQFAAGPARPNVRPRMHADSSGYVKLGFRLDGKSHTVKQADVTLGIDTHRVRYVPSKAPAPAHELFSTAEGFFRVASEANGRALLELVRHDFPGVPGGADEHVKSVQSFLSFDPRPTFLGRGCFPVAPWLRTWGLDARAPQTARGADGAVLGTRISDVVYGPAAALTDLLSQLAYLGPLRAAPTRFQARSGAQYSSVGARGEHTPLFLLQLPDLIGPVNAWLERLEIRYRLEVSPVEADTIGAEIGDLVVTRLVDTHTGIAVTPQDVGFGISQLLPVVVQVLAERGRTICIEQPEIHIHPRLQAMLADLFIEAAEHHANQLVIETHSEHLMLRFLRRMSEARGSGWLSPDKLCVLYVDQDAEGVSTPQRLRLDAHGEFLDEWPNGFFTERLEELFFGARKRRRQVGRRTRSRHAS
ncbi:MAG: AAA family ATPase [Conexibacter sp.]